MVSICTLSQILGFGVKTTHLTNLTFARPFPNGSERQLDLTDLFIFGPVSPLWQQPRRAELSANLQRWKAET